MTIAVTIAWTERTYTMNQKIKLLQDAYAKVGDGLKIYNQYCRLCGLDEIDCIVSDDQTTEDTIQKYEKAHVKVITPRSGQVRG